MNNETRWLSRRGMLQGSGAMLGALGLISATGFGAPGSVKADERQYDMSEQKMSTITTKDGTRIDTPGSIQRRLAGIHQGLRSLSW